MNMVFSQKHPWAISNIFYEGDDCLVFGDQTSFLPKGWVDKRKIFVIRSKVFCLRRSYSLLTTEIFNRISTQ